MKYAQSNGKQTLVERNITRYTQDPVRYETGQADEAVKIRSIKAVRLG